MLSRQPGAHRTIHRRDHSRRLCASLRPHLNVARTRASEQQYGPRQVVARPDGPEQRGGQSGSERDSDSDTESLPLLVAEAKGDDTSKAGTLAGLGSIGGIVLLLASGMLLKDTIKDFLEFFISAVDSWGPLGYVAYAAVYTGLEVLAVPAIPLTMTAGVIFGPIPGTIVTSLSGTAAATIAFLIARYAARDRVMRWARRNSKFAAIDRAIAKNGFKVGEISHDTEMMAGSVRRGK
ncbi:hypothetical protein Agub_g176 [Astrephomene gubernaculifera]|uniref:VTT domain-containing protein n=1 Tax=Astrephomene gubernaculifera TaxID=47775 RepID=A0AAD3HG87_9CHLO|nr:hypothetical protein Agub_g176 [Astrephomene gubernaculifera]